MFNCNIIHSLRLQGVADAPPLKRSTALPVRPGPEFSGTVGDLVDVLVEFVFPSENGVTYLSDTWVMATPRDNIFNLQRFFLISMQYLPYCKITCT